MVNKTKIMQGVRFGAFYIANNDIGNANVRTMVTYDSKRLNIKEN